MKIFLKRIVFIAGIISAISLSGCKKDDNSSSEFSIVGSWRFKSYSKLSYANNAIIKTVSTSNYGSVKFRSDGTGEYRHANGEVYATFNWTFSDNILTTKGENLNNGEEQATVTIVDSKTMKINIKISERTSENNGVTIVYSEVIIGTLEK